MALLEIAGLTVRHGGVVAVDDVSLTVDAGQVVGVTGPNGAGKSTLLDAVCGLQPVAGGTVGIDGRAVTRYPPSRRARLGMARTFERPRVFGSLTVRDNVLLAADVRGGWWRRRRPGGVEELLDRVGIAGHAGTLAGDLPAGVARLVELARALAGRPRLLLLDEPSAGLDEDTATWVGALLREQAAGGCAVLLTEHDPATAGFCDEVHALHLGRVVTEVPR